MCRHLARIGPATTLSSIVLEPPHSLERQSWEPTHQTHGVVNADGFGVGWFDARRPEPAVYRSTLPIWADTTFTSIAGVIDAEAMLAVVRSATPGFTTDGPSTPPFASGPWLFAHNGAIDDYRDGVGEELRAQVSRRRAGELTSTVDSALLFAMTLDRLDAGDAPADALAAVIQTVRKVADGRLNLLLTDGRTIAATASGASLFTRARNDEVVVASEPWDDDPGWAAVPDATLVVATRRSLSTDAL